MVHPHSSTSPQNEVYTALSSNDVTYFSHLEGIRGILKRPLHLTSFEPSKIAPFIMRRAVRMLLGQMSKPCGIAIDLTRVIPQNLDSVRLGTRNVGLKHR